MNNRLSDWDEPQLDPLTPPPQDFEGLSTEESAEIIKDWFFENFEDPAETTPYESREGGYIYIWGGPYDTSDIIWSVFEDTVSLEVIQASIDEIQSGGLFEWAPNHRRIQPPEPDEDDANHHQIENLAEKHRQMVIRLDDLEAAIAQLAQEPAGIGHNHPPEPIEDEGLSPADIAEIKECAAALKYQPQEPENISIVAKETVDRLSALRDKLGKYMAEKADLFVSEVVKESAKWVVRLPLWGSILAALSAAIDAAKTWLHAIPSF